MTSANNPTSSEGENVSEIQVLTHRVLTLNQATDWWNGAMIVALIVAALAAIAVVGTTIMALKRARQAGDAQSELIQIKDRQLASDLRDKDVKIAQAGKDAAEANRIAETEHLARVQIEARVAWRHLTEDEQKEIGATIGRRFSKLGVSLWFSTGDTESSFFAGDIARAFVAAKTLLVQPPGSILMMRETGKFGDPVKPSDTGVVVQSTMHESSRELAEAIIHELTTRGFDAIRQKDPPFDSNPAPQVWVNVWARPEGPQGEYKLAAQRGPVKK